MPLDMVDTCLCMGAGVNMTQGIGKIEPDTTCFAFVGDSTFFASAITGMVNAVYNQANMTLVVLDNSTTAMTGHQPHPGTGKTMMGQVVDKVSIEDTLHGIGVKTVETVNPLHLQEAIDCVKRVAVQDGVKAIIFKSPCAVLIKSGKPAQIEESKCIQCKKCIRTLGCPAIMLQDGKVQIEQALCTGCGLCAQVCPTAAIGGACHA
jgi:indolepyruvate ferredoxin oxidoreductase alpha subunit